MCKSNIKVIPNLEPWEVMKAVVYEGSKTTTQWRGQTDSWVANDDVDWVW